VTPSPDQNVVERLRELEQAATPGPWLYIYAPDDSYGNEIIMVKDVGGGQIQYAENCYTPETEKANSQLIAEIRTHLPALLAVVEAAEYAFHHAPMFSVSWSRLKGALARLEDTKSP